MIGKNYSPVESTEVLPAGNYTAKILKATETDTQYGKQVIVEVTIKDHQGCSPRICYVNDEPTQGYGKLSYDEALKLWCRNMTKFFDSFKIPRGMFDTTKWINKVGTVTVQPQRKHPEYMELVLWEQKPYDPSAPNHTASSPAPVQNQADDTFSEDVPF